MIDRKSAQQIGKNLQIDLPPLMTRTSTRIDYITVYALLVLYGAAAAKANDCSSTAIE